MFSGHCKCSTKESFTILKKILFCWRKKVNLFADYSLGTIPTVPNVKATTNYEHCKLTIQYIYFLHYRLIYSRYSESLREVKDCKTFEMVKLRGKINSVFSLLQTKFRERKLRLECEQQVATILREAALNYQLNPLLATMCKNEVNVKISVL